MKKKGKIFLRKFSDFKGEYTEIELNADFIRFYTHEHDYIDIKFKGFDLSIKGIGQFKVIPNSSNSIIIEQEEP